MTVIIDYDAGNLRSVQRACAEVGLAARISNDAHVVARADRVIFPGVGAAAPAMKSLRENGLDVALRDAIAAGTPVLGICLGLQISLDRSEEGDTPTLGLIEGRVVRFHLDDPALKIPHMGWNEVVLVRPHPLLRKMTPGSEFYFVHSYYPEPAARGDVYAETVYERTFACALGRGNYFATQFHPEKSGRVGLELLSCFATWDGRSC
jgi:imidazole glycerol-phosphate synthase subunit HisH